MITVASKVKGHSMMNPFLEVLNDRSRDGEKMSQKD